MVRRNNDASVSLSCLNVIANCPYSLYESTAITTLQRCRKLYVWYFNNTRWFVAFILDRRNNNIDDQVFCPRRFSVSISKRFYTTSASFRNYNKIFLVFVTFVFSILWCLYSWFCHFSRFLHDRGNFHPPFLQMNFYSWKTFQRYALIRSFSEFFKN